MAEIIYIKLGEMQVEKNRGVFKAPENGRKTYTKDQFDVVATTSDGYKYVGLKAYDLDSFHPKDKEIIRSHNTEKTNNELEYYTFNRGRTFEEIKKVKDSILEEMEKKSSFPMIIKENDETIFGQVTVEFNIPKIVIEKQKLQEQITWNCWDDNWKNPYMQSIEREFLEELYKKKGRAGDKKNEKTNN